jgi:hypothetical protein
MLLIHGRTLCYLVLLLDRAIAQAGSRRLPTAAARVRAQVRHVGFVVDKVALGRFFSDYFGFHRQFSLHRLLHIHHLSFGAGTIGQINQTNSVSPYPKKIKLKKASAIISTAQSTQF